MKRFNLLNTIFGWLAFVIAAITYLLTMEPTASFWDCGEFISSIYKLDVGHPPGAPFFMLAGKFFTLFASDPTQVALMVNSLSALLSALTILFLFWTITHLARKIIIKDDSSYTKANIISILGAGLVGSLAYTFSDTFWFSAVEGEVYAFSSFFTAVVFWLILKWESVADQKGSDRWLILIAYLIGLSIGVHLLNLLTIPAIVLVYYFKKNTPSTKGIIIAGVSSVLLLAFVLYGLIPGFVEVAGWFELFFVQTLSFPFNTGLFVYVALASAILIWAIYETYTAKSPLRMSIAFIAAFSIVGIPFIKANVWIGIVIILLLIGFFYYKKGLVSARWLNTAVVMITVMLIGYSSYTVIMIRSAANPPMDQNSPDNIFSLKYYLNRDQYGDTHLLYGPMYTAPIKLKEQGRYCVPEEVIGAPIYAPKPKESPEEKDSYIITGHKMSYKTEEKFNMLFPRMPQNPGLTERHKEAYKYWAGKNRGGTREIKGRKISYDSCGQTKTDVCPTFVENMRFFYRYQLNFMYWRYFMWNFSGRQNDIQSNGEIENGNWITGFKFIDNYLVGDQDTLPTLLKENKGRNRYYMLPLLLGIIGLLFTLNNGKKARQNFWIILLLFILTGVAIVVYLNQTPYQPRERDYAYAASFYAFSIWIGFGVLGIVKVFNKYLPKTTSAIAVSVICLGVPVLMACENWDDHDRSNRYLVRDFGANYLNSCQKNGIIFSNGDNDTFPLWYNQEVEGTRTDVRVCNLSYLQTDWYIDQMRRGAYDSPPLPILWQPKDYISGKNEVAYVREVTNKALNIETAFKYLLSDRTKEQGESIIPTKTLYIPVDADQVIKTGTLPEARRDEILPNIEIKLKNRLLKSELMILEMLKENKWERPMYFCVTVGDSYYMGLKDHFELTGLAYKIVPVKSKTGIDIEEMYDNMMHKFRYGNVNDPKVYIDEQSMRMCRTHRMMFIHLVNALIDEGDNTRAKKALDFCEEMLPNTTIPHDDYWSTLLASAYYKIGENEKGEAINLNVADDCIEHFNWYMHLKDYQQGSAQEMLGQKLALLNHVINMSGAAGRKEAFAEHEKVLDQIKRTLNYR